GPARPPTPRRPSAASTPCGAPPAHGRRPSPCRESNVRLLSHPAVRPRLEGPPGPPANRPSWTIWECGGCPGCSRAEPFPPRVLWFPYRFRGGFNARLIHFSITFRKFIHTKFITIGDVRPVSLDPVRA